MSVAQLQAIRRGSLCWRLLGFVGRGSLGGSAQDSDPGLGSGGGHRLGGFHDGLNYLGVAGAPA
jgi:hypothetical protein